MPRYVAFVLAWAIANMGMPRIGGLLLLQWHFGLRPGEALDVHVEHLISRLRALPGGITPATPTVLLKPKEGTKVGRPQYVMCAPAHADMAELLIQAFTNSSVRGVRLTNLGDVAHFNRILAKAAHMMRLSNHFTPHSARAGWATELRLAGTTFQELQEMGRWECPKTLRMYLDVAGILSLQIAEPHIQPVYA